MFIIKRTMNPDNPVMPIVRSFPPLRNIIPIPAVALRLPWSIEGPITDFDFIRMYVKIGE